PGQRPGAGLRVDVVDLDTTLLVGPQLPAVRVPGQLFRDHCPVVVNRHLVEGDVRHRTDALGQFEVALAVDVGVAAPQVGARQVRGRPLQALVPAVGVGAVRGDG